MLAVVAVAVTVALPEIAPGTFGGILGDAAAAATGSIVSQGIGLATGIQDMFSFKAVAETAIAGVGGPEPTPTCLPLSARRPPPTR